MPEKPGKTPEQEKPAYFLTAQFQDEAVAEAAYLDAQKVIYDDEKCNLSVFRFLNVPDGSWYVVALGEVPSPLTQENLQAKLKEGREAELPPEIVRGLVQRRLEQIKLGSWVERHYRPAENRSNRAAPKRHKKRRRHK